MAQSRIERVLDETIEKAKKCKFRSNDISDLKRIKLLLWATKIPIRLIRGFFTRPLNYLVKYKPNLIRPFISKKGFIYPQGQAMFIRGQVSLLKKNHSLGDLALCEEIAHWLIENRNKEYNNYCWGQPFLWFSRKPFPPNLPRATVTSQVAWAFLDLYEITEKQEYLNNAISSCNFFIEDLNYTNDAMGNYCFSYTTIDNYHVHNASLLAASVLSRVGRITANDKFNQAALKAVNFSIHHQNEDGSWYYWAPPDKLVYKIDNYHTGFNLEALHTIWEDTKDDKILAAYSLGLSYYLDNLFEGSIPKITNKKTYPIDIQSCAQSIVTFSLAGSIDVVYYEKAKEIIEYSIENFYIKSSGNFGFRKYQNGYLDKSYYFRWGDSWMIKALSMQIDKND
jgi:hypothetical protein